MKTVRSQVDAGLPLRLSTRADDRYFDAKAVSLSDKVDVLLDGKVLDQVTSWDVPAGKIVRHRRDSQEKLILEFGAPAFETLKGVVEVRWIRTEGGAA